MYKGTIKIEISKRCSEIIYSFSFSSFSQPVQRYKSPYFRLKTVISTSSDNHFQPTAQPKEISRLQAGASTTLTDGTLLLYGCASGSFYDCLPTPFYPTEYLWENISDNNSLLLFLSKILFSKSRFFFSAASSFLFF